MGRATPTALKERRTQTKGKMNARHWQSASIKRQLASNKWHTEHRYQAAQSRTRVVSSLSLRRTWARCCPPTRSSHVPSLPPFGQDLSSIAFPVTFNEPLSLLQRTAEEVEYYDLLSEASQTQDPVERMCYVAAFAVSGYAHTRHRSSRKGL